MNSGHYGPAPTRRPGSPANGTTHQSPQCGSMGCIIGDKSAMSACVEPAQAQSSVNWRHVGQGNGGYEMISWNQYASQRDPALFTADGRPKPPSRNVETKFCAGFVTMLALVSVAFVCVTNVGGPTVTTKSAASEMPATPPPERDPIVVVPAESSVEESAIAEPQPLQVEQHLVEQQPVEQSGGPPVEPPVAESVAEPVAQPVAQPVVHRQEFTFDCVDQRVAWDVERRTWCCSKFGVQCEEPTTSMAAIPVAVPAQPLPIGPPVGQMPDPAAEGGLPVVAAAEPPVPPEVPLADSSSVSSASLIYDCQAGLSNWKQEWSLAKMAWCCYQDGVGCPPTHEDSPKEEGTEAPSLHAPKLVKLSSPLASSTRTSTTARPKTTTTKLAPGELAAAIAAKAAAQVEGAHSISHTSTTTVETNPWTWTSTTTPGSTSTTELTTEPWTWTSTTTLGSTSTTEVTTTTQQTTTTKEVMEAALSSAELDKFLPPDTTTKAVSVHSVTIDMEADDMHGPMAGASIDILPLASDAGELEVEEVTQHIVEVTQPPAAAAGGGGIFDCKIGQSRWEKGWSVLKRAWCCKHENIACGTYDCSEDLSKWRTSWPPAKKDWCCKNERKGCKAPAAPQSPQDPFACHIGLKHWQDEWSNAKKTWCCSHQQLGCPDDSVQSFDCSEGLATWRTQWSSSKKDWCCQNEGFGCSSAREHQVAKPTLPYDCQTQLMHWRSQWSQLKQKWCCQHESLGCDVRK